MRLTKALLSRICCACDATNRIFNVLCFGAKGDDHVDDFHAIRNARDALNAAGGGVLFFPPGTYIVSETIELGSNTTVLGSGPGSVLRAKSSVTGFNMLFTQNSRDVRVRDLVLDGNRGATGEPTEPNIENKGCGFLAHLEEGQTGLRIENVIARTHHGSGIRLTGPLNDDDVYKLKTNEVEVLGCRVHDCGRRGIVVNRATQARIAGNVVTRCTQAGIQLLSSRSAVIEGNVVQNTLQEPNTTGGHGIMVADSFDFVIANNVATDNVRWGIVASGGVGVSPLRSQRYVVANNVCRANHNGGITVDPTAANNPTEIQDSFATVASNVCAGNEGHGIHSTHAGYLAVHGNICDGNTEGGVAIHSSRHAVVADNVVSNNRTYGITLRTSQSNPVEGPGHHLLGGNVYDGNTNGEIVIGTNHPAIRQLQDRWPSDETAAIGKTGGWNLPVKITDGDPPDPVEGLFYVNTAESSLRLYANGAWHTLHSTSGTSW